MNNNNNNNNRYEKYLKLSLDALFRETENNGFWNEKDGYIICQLDYPSKKNDNKWVADNIVEFRFGPFGLMGALYWRYTNPQSNPDYDSKMERYLNFLSNKILENGQIPGNKNGFEHGIVLATLALGYLVFNKNAPSNAENNLKKAELIYRFIQKNWTPDTISDNHDLFVLWGFDWLYDAEIAKGEMTKADDIKNEILRLSNWMHTILDSNIFNTGDFRAAYHQRIMYPLWGFAKAVKITNNNLHLQSIQRCLDYVIKNRMDWDGAFKWHHSIWIYKKNKSFIKWRLGINPFGKYLFECHQTFFINAVEQYYYGGGTKNYLPDEIRAIEWIFKTNRRGKNMVEECEIGVPLRMMDTKGKINIQGQTFKGTYEVGSYIMALSDLVKKNND